MDFRSDPCVYVYYTDGNSIITSAANTGKKPEDILALYVGDLMLAGIHKTVLRTRKEKEQLMSCFATADMGNLSLIVGMQSPSSGRTERLPPSKQTTLDPC